MHTSRVLMSSAGVSADRVDRLEEPLKRPPTVLIANAIGHQADAEVAGLVWTRSSVLHLARRSTQLASGLGYFLGTPPRLTAVKYILSVCRLPVAFGYRLGFAFGGIGTYALCALWREG